MRFYIAIILFFVLLIAFIFYKMGVASVPYCIGFLIGFFVGSEAKSKGGAE